jgi:hypothetical protein
MGRTAHDAPARARDDGAVEDQGTLHRIEDDLAEDWLEEWARAGVEAIEEYLAKHLAFLTFLDEAAA